MRTIGVVLLKPQADFLIEQIHRHHCISLFQALNLDCFIEAFYECVNLRGFWSGEGVLNALYCAFRIELLEELTAIVGLHHLKGYIAGEEQTDLLEKILGIP